MPLDGPAKAVAWALAARMNGDNACWPSKTRLCEDCGFSVRTVDRAVRRLEIVGLLKVRRRPPAPNVYMACTPRHSDGVTPSETTPHPVTGAGEDFEEEIEGFAYAIQVDKTMLELAHGWITAHH
jgi:DNA-binding transcriptional MocR family regulator